MSDKNGLAMKHSEDEKSKEFQEFLTEVDKLKDGLKSERSKNADADRKRTYTVEPPLVYRARPILSACTTRGSTSGEDGSSSID